MGLQKPDTSVLWKNGSYTFFEAVSPSQSVGSQELKANNMTARASGAGYTVNNPVAVTSADAVAGNFSVRASGTLNALGLFSAVINSYQISKEYPGLSFVEGLNMMMGVPPPLPLYSYRIH